jgi:hypothetical protein
MFSAGKKLPLALILESHLKEIENSLSKPGIMPAMAGASSAKKLSGISDSCYVCSRIEYNFTRMMDTAAYLWETDEEFRRKCKKQEGFCVPHAAEYLTAAKARMKGKVFVQLYGDIYNIQSKHMDGISEKLSRFVKSFDYRYADVPIEDARDAVEKTIELITGEYPKR